MSIALPWLPPGSPIVNFPPVDTALDEPEGLLCAGGDLSLERLKLAYQSGVFPWFSEGDPIMWWSPNPRTIFRVDQFKPSRRLARTLRNHPYRLSFDEDFAGVIDACAEIPRADQDGTWITTEMKAAYIELHKAGYAHSVEVWDGSDLVGGMYGPSLGKIFFGESMFSRKRDASKIAICALMKLLQAKGFTILDAQVWNDHLGSLGATEVHRDYFMDLVRGNQKEEDLVGSWQRFNPLQSTTD